MKVQKIIIILIIALLSISITVQSEHYYGNGAQIPLGIDSNRVLIRMDSTMPVPENMSLADIIGRISQVLVDSSLTDGFIAYSLSSTVGYDAFLDSLDTLPGIDLVEPYHVDGYNVPFTVGDHFCVAFDEAISESTIDSINNSYGVSITHSLEGMDNVFVLRNSSTSNLRMLEIANEYYELDETRYSHPSFNVRTELFGYNLYDYYGSNQDHIKKVIGSFNDKSVWDFHGLTDTIVVALIDDGLAAHEDLPASRIMTGWDYKNPFGGTDVTPEVISAHGMGCAGIIGASHTTDSIEGLSPTSGVVSLDPHVKILPLKIFNGFWGAGDVRTTEAIMHAADSGAHVINNSWGYTSPTAYFDNISDALDRAAIFGRGGRGCPIIFASGNGGDSLSNIVAFPARHQYVMAVGATELDDTRWYYSQYGAELDLVAPSGEKNLQGDVWTLDQMDSVGYNSIYRRDCQPVNNVDYNCNFGGTSAAAPIVSGTAALLLSFDSTLSSAAVYYILRNSAVTELESGMITPPDTAYGYGRVDAFRAILSLARGDMDADGKMNLSDITRLIGQVYLGGPDGFPDARLGNCDCSSDGSINLADITKLIDHVYLSKAPLPLPCFVY